MKYIFLHFSYFIPSIRFRLNRTRMQLQLFEPIVKWTYLSLLISNNPKEEDTNYYERYVVDIWRFQTFSIFEYLLFELFNFSFRSFLFGITASVWQSLLYLNQLGLCVLFFPISFFKLLWICILGLFSLILLQFHRFCLLILFLYLLFYFGHVIERGYVLLNPGAPCLEISTLCSESLWGYHTLHHRWFMKINVYALSYYAFWSLSFRGRYDPFFLWIEWVRVWCTAYLIENPHLYQLRSFDKNHPYFDQMARADLQNVGY